MYNLTIVHGSNMMILRTLLLIFLTLSSQAESFLCFGSCNQWRLSTICAPTDSCSSTKIYYTNNSPLNGTTAEILLTPDCANFILGFLWCPLNGPSQDRFAHVTVTPSNLPPRLFSPYCCLGNMKLIFSEEDTKILVRMLLLGHSLTFSTGMYETTLPPEGFISCWKRV